VNTVGSSVSLFGVADTAAYREQFPSAGWNLPLDLPRAIVAAYPLSRAVLSTVDGAPNPLYFHHYRQVNYQLDTAALEIARGLEKEGFRALPVAASQTLDAEDRTAHLSHRHMGYLAGLGWRGKCNLLVSPLLGAGIRLVTVLTDAPLPVSRPMADRDCGSCDRCAKACPARAIGTDCAAFDLARCAALLSQFRTIPRVGQRICGVCQRACMEGGTWREHTASRTASRP
jgi:epoxyqueuosine reductase QueG